MNGTKFRKSVAQKVLEMTSSTILHYASGATNKLASLGLDFYDLSFRQFYWNQAKKNTSFYFLEEDEMTFNKERHPDPEQIRHHLSFDNWESAKKLLGQKLKSIENP